LVYSGIFFLAVHIFDGFFNDFLRAGHESSQGLYFNAHSQVNWAALHMQSIGATKNQNTFIEYCAIKRK
jgi:hypothetical protein